MISFWMEKKWVQVTLLLAITALGAYYWGWVFDFGYKFDWSVLFTVNETYGEHYGLLMLKGLAWTVIIALFSSVIALSLGIVVGLGRVSQFKPVYWLSTGYVEFFRNTPLLVQLLFWYFALPQALPEGAREWLYNFQFTLMDALPTWLHWLVPQWLSQFSFAMEFCLATLGLAVYTGSFMAEVIRAGLQSIPKGLLEASYACGLTYPQVLRKVVLPIAFRAIIPPLGSEFLNNMKNSSLAMVVGVTELCWSSQQVESMTFHGFEGATAASVLYLSLSLIISAGLNAVNIRLRIERSGVPGLAERVVNTVVNPMSLTCRMVAMPVQRTVAAVASRQRASRSASFSPARVAFNNVVATGWKVLGLGAKGLFLAGLGYLLFMAAKGVLGLHWPVIFENLKTLLIWRFPIDDPNESLFGSGGLMLSILLAFIAIVCSSPLGLLAGLGRTSKNLLFKIPSVLYIEVIRGNPLIMVIYWIYFFIPVVTGSYPDVVVSAAVALTIFTGAYLAEIVRAGIENIPPGQFEAAKSTGLSYYQTMRRVILPQALKQMIPPIVGQFIAIFKDTSLVYVLQVKELLTVVYILNNRIGIYPMELYFAAFALYFICCYAMSMYANRLERRLSPEKQVLQM